MTTSSARVWLSTLGALTGTVVAVFLLAGCSGDASVPDASAPDASAERPQWREIAAGNAHTCGITGDGSLYCWGSNGMGQLGDGSTEDRARPVRVGSDDDWETVSATGDHTCALKSGGSLFCWGETRWAPVADEQQGSGGASGNTEPPAPEPLVDRLVPTQIDVDSDWRSGSAGSPACGIKAEGTLHCWTAGQAEVITDSRVGPDNDWESVSVGHGHACGLREAGALYCWGSNGSGQLGIGTRESADEPTRVAPDDRWAQVVAGRDHSCGITVDGSLRCWGDNAMTRLGYGDGNGSDVPVAIGSDADWATLSADMHTCAIKTNASLHCWGFNYSGQVGDGTSGADGHHVKGMPTQVLSMLQWSRVANGASHTCGITSGGSLYCWGEAGALGTGDQADRTTPVPVGFE